MYVVTKEVLKESCRKGKIKTRWVGCWRGAAAWNLKCSLYLFYSRDISTPETSPEWLTLFEITTIMCELKSHSMDSTCKNRSEVPQGEEPPQRSRAARLLDLPAQPNRITPHCDAKGLKRGLYFSVAGESSDAGGGIPQRGRRAGCLSSKPSLKAPSPSRLSTSNS